jgi:rhodanese-related sulfurtransferase
MRLGRIGFDHIAGFLKDGATALQGHPELVGTIERVSAVELSALMASGEPPTVLDVRNVPECQSKRIEGSLNIPLNRLSSRMADIPRGRRIAVHCAGGYRSAMAASLLRLQGNLDVTDLVGGLAAWEGAHLPLLSGSPAEQAS